MTGERLAAAGVMAALVDDEGTVLAANKPFADRAIGAAEPEPSDEDMRFTDLVRTAPDGLLYLVAEGESARPLRAVHVPDRRRVRRRRGDAAAVRAARQCQPRQFDQRPGACSKSCRSGWRWSIATGAS